MKGILVILCIVIGSSKLVAQTDLTISSAMPISVCVGETYPMEVNILNLLNSNIPANDVYVSWRYADSTFWQTELYNFAINGASVIPYTFANTLTLTSCGPQDIEIAVHGSVDNDVTNDTIIFQINGVCISNPVSISGDTVCADSSTVLEVDINSPFVPEVLTWFKSNDGGQTWQNQFHQLNTFVFGPPTPGSRALAVFDGRGICPNDSVEIVLIPIPIFNFYTVGSGNNSVTVCDNAQKMGVIIQHINGMNDNIEFTTNGNGNFANPFSDTTDYFIDPSDFSNSNLYIYGESQMPAQCPYTDSLKVEWSVSPLANIIGPAVACDGDTVSFTGTGGISYSWYLDLQNTGNPMSYSNPFEFVVDPTIDSVALYVIALNTCSDTTAIAIEVEESPDISSFDTLICPGELIQLNVNASDPVGGGLAWQWFGNLSSNLNNTAVSNPIFTQSTIGDLYLEVTDQNNCSDVDTFTVAYHPGINFDFFPDSTICEGDSIILQTNSTSTSLVWYIDQATLVSTLPNPMVSPLQNESFFIEAVDGPCLIYDTINIYIDSLWNRVIMADSFFCHQPDFLAEVSVGNASTVNWYIDGGMFTPNSTTLVCPIMDEDSMEVICEVITLNNCSYDISRVLYPGTPFQCAEEFSNAFSPNGDGINDVWIISILDATLPNKLKIYTRYGDELISFENYDNVNVVWDGKNKQGQSVPSGVYFYVLEVQDSKVSGWVNLSK